MGRRGSPSGAWSANCFSTLLATCNGIWAPSKVGSGRDRSGVYLASNSRLIPEPLKTDILKAGNRRGYPHAVNDNMGSHPGEPL